jgi:hypothetical protein
MSDHKNQISLFQIIVGAATIVACLAALSVVPEIRELFGLDSVITPDAPTIVPTSAVVLTPMSTLNQPTIATASMSPFPSENPPQNLGGWIITIGKYESIDLAKSDASRYTSKGYHVEIFCRISEVTPGGPVEIRAAVVGFETEEAVNIEAPNVRNINPYAQIKPLAAWCPDLENFGNYVSCKSNVCQ